MPRSTPLRTTGRVARRAQQAQQQRDSKKKQSTWQPVAMCAVLALILALSIVFGRPVGGSVPINASPLPTASEAAPTASASATPSQKPTPSAQPASTLPPKPEYSAGVEDPFDQAYQRYQQDIMGKKYADQQGVADLDIFGKETLTPRWFGLTVKDLPALRDKLLSGSPTAYTMSLISLILGYDPPTHPTDSEPASLRAWLQDYEARRAAAGDFAAGKTEKQSAMQLPAVYAQIEAGAGGDLFAVLPVLTDGFDGLSKSDTVKWTQADWLVWLRNRKAEWDVIADFVKEPIALPWIAAQ